jgi:hypothetical protein
MFASSVVSKLSIPLFNDLAPYFDVYLSLSDDCMAETPSTGSRSGFSTQRSGTFVLKFMIIFPFR